MDLLETSITKSKLPTESTANVEDILTQVDPSVPQEEKDKLKEHLRNYADVLWKDEHDLGCTNIVQHHINTGNNRPCRQATRPQSVTTRQIINQAIDEFQLSGTNELCQS